jgi:DNA-binding IclR family transcriptional regulator
VEGGRALINRKVKKKEKAARSGRETPTVAASNQAGVRSIETGARLLAALATLTYDGPPPMLKTVAAAAGLAPAKAHRYLVSLLRSTMVERDEGTGRYRLGPLARHIGISSIRGMHVLRTATLHLPNVLDEIKHSVVVAVWSEKGPIVVWVEDYPRPITIHTRVGEVLPLLTSATGRVYGAWLPRGQTEALVDQELRAMWEFPRTKSILRREDVDLLFEQVRSAGVGWTAGGLLPGMNALAAPIFDFRGGVVAALGSLGPETTFDVAPDGRLADALRSGAARISEALGYRASKRSK